MATPFLERGGFSSLKGLINKAADIPYRRAWSYLHAMEKRLGIKMLNTRIGGANGGGTELSKEAREFLCKFEYLSSNLERFIEKEFSGFFDYDALC